MYHFILIKLIQVNKIIDRLVSNMTAGTPSKYLTMKQVKVFKKELLEKLVILFKNTLKELFIFTI